MVGKKLKKKIFPETHVYRKLKTMEKNRLEKVRKNVFFYKNTNIVIKNWAEKTRGKIYQKTQK